MNQAPSTYISLCKIAGFSEKEAQTKWIKLWKKTIQEFLVWLIDEDKLSQNQLLKLENHLKIIIKEKESDKSVFDLIASILEPEKRRKAVKKFAGFFITNLTGFYDKLQKSLSLEQNQVFKSYLEASRQQTKYV